MFFLFQYSKAGLPGGLINLHQSLLESITSYFEKGESVKTRVREIRKSLRDTITFAKKKRIYPSSKTNRAAELMEEMYEELELTHKILKRIANEMEKMINQIKEKRVIGVHSILPRRRNILR
jgi:ribosome maturation protein Sdo1